VVGLETVARRLRGDDISYVDEVERCYGIRLERIPEEEFEAAHGALDEALPGNGDLADRYQAWARLLEVPRETLLALVRALNDELRTRSRTLVELPDGEDTEIELVENEPWAAFNYYLGGLRSRVVFNTDVPLHAHQLAATVAHELYPGHHTEHALKEALYVRGAGEREHTIMLVGTPECLISEGIAEVALDMLLGEDAHRFGAEHAAAAGVPYDPEVARRVVDARRALAGASVNTALLLHVEGGTRDEAIAYTRRWVLVDERRAARMVDFVLDPTWRAYVACYTEGERLAESYVAGDRERFRRLLVERLTPEDLTPAATPR
jgi:hypothetical protein